MKHPIEKKIPLMELFGPTIQGEGAQIGVPTFFLRFGLCDYKCAMCDSMHAVKPQEVRRNAAWLTQQEIFNRFLQHYSTSGNAGWVTFSGGNPALYNLELLYGLFNKVGFRINVETQGTRYHPWLSLVDMVTVSPKSPGMKNPGGETSPDTLIEFLDCVYGLKGLSGKLETHIESTNAPELCVKIVVFDEEDINYAEKIQVRLLQHKVHVPLYLSLGNPFLPGETTLNPTEMTANLMERYDNLTGKILSNQFLSSGNCDVRFLPQLHVLAWGNEQGV